jgi:hypothetical protein
MGKGGRLTETGQVHFIPVIPSAVATLLEGTTTSSWPSYPWLNLAGSAAYTPHERGFKCVGAQTHDGIL